ncbi:MAG: alpha/beta hydrolase [Oscillochloris sp.]|nr:alpha/beta hydrolase [Oscillochloris sp.]
MYTVETYLAQPVVAADRRIRYGESADQFADLYLPAGAGPHPVVLLIHGGCWQQRYDLAPLGALGADLRAAGVAVWSIEYRRLGGAGGWPATFHDAAAAADRLATLAESYHLDLARVAAVGHSAGGHLALWLAARHRLSSDAPLFTPDPLPLRAVVALAAIGDLAAGAAEQLCGTACRDLVAADPRNYAWASPAALLPLGIPHHHIVGAEDAIVPANYVKRFVAQAQAAGDPTTITVVPNAAHFEPVAVATAAWLHVRRTILQMLA